MRRCLSILILTGSLFTTNWAYGESSAPSRVVSRQPFDTGSLKQSISVRVQNVDKLVQSAELAHTRPVLFLDGQEITNVFGTLSGNVDASGVGTLVFYLDRDSSNRAAWKNILARPTLEPRTVALSVGLPGGTPIPTDWTTFRLTVLHVDWLTAWSVAFLAFVILFVWMARTSALLRDKGSQGNKGSYSLARCQMAWWFFLVLASYLFLYMVTWDFNTVSSGTLALIGISAATGLAGAVIDSSKTTQLKTESKQLKVERAGLPPAAAIRSVEITNRVSEIQAQISSVHLTFLSDILSDSDGLSFHRFQIFVWTIVLGVIFIIAVYSDLLMPDFSATQLGLMAISSGTYIGFKFPETKG